jgi:hypothetical protein
MGHGKNYNYMKNFRHYILFSFFIMTSAWAQLPQKDLIGPKLILGLEPQQTPQILELTDLRVKIPSPVKRSSDEKCVFLIHADKYNNDVYKIGNNVDTLIENSHNNCEMLKEVQNYKELAKQDKRWSFSFYFGFSRTKYLPTDMKLESSRVNVEIKDFEFKERTSASFYNPTTWESIGDSFRWIDEPTNHFIITAEKKNHNIIISIFHPKYLKKDYQTKYVKGTVDGVDIDGYVPINEEFDGYNNQPGEMFLVRFQNTHMQMAWQVGYGYDIKIFDSQKAGKLSIRPAVYLGMMTGRHLTVYTKPGEYWDYDEYEDRDRIHGPMFSVGLRLNYRIKNFNLFVDTKYSKAWITHGFMDGTAKYEHQQIPLTFGVGYTLKTKKKKKRTKP